MKRRNNLGISLLFIGVFLISIFSVAANFGPIGTIVQVAEGLNFGDDPKNLTVNVFYNCTGTRVFNITIPAGFSLFSTGAPCGLINSSLASCTFSDVSPFNLGSYTFSTSQSVSDHSVTEFPSILSNTTSCAVTNNISILKISDAEVFHTLVEYGRGRGNYFFTTANAGKAGSGSTGLGCPYVPNATMFELNFLHKVFNVKQYYGSADMIAINATFSCTYPNKTIVRSHLGQSISRGAVTNISYLIDEIEGSFERTAYLGMDFDSSELNVGDKLAIECSNIKYLLPQQSGNITVFVNGSSFELEVRNPKPFAASASSTSIVGNGTQEVLITYNITNNELYTANDVVIEIDAPPFAEFIGTRAELWGTGRDQYRIERIELGTGESEIITLLARFDTSTAPPASTISLSQGIRTQYVTCWDINAYNPAESVQNIGITDTVSLNLSASTSIITLQGTLNTILNTLSLVSSTTQQINNTITTINNLVNVINTTTQETNLIVQELNNTINSIVNSTDLALNNTQQAINNTNVVLELIDCDNISDSVICEGLDSINDTITNVQGILLQINNTLQNITINVTIDLSNQNITANVTANLTNASIIIDDILGELNCTNVTSAPEELCTRASRIQNNTIEINNSLNQISALVDFFDSTVFGNITLQEIVSSMNNITVDTSSLLNEISQIQDFDEEIIFLITDSFGLQQEAAKDFNNADPQSAAAKLREANNRLDEATERLIANREEAQQKIGSAYTSATSSSLLPLVALLALVISLLFFYVWRKKE